MIDAASVATEAGWTQMTLHNSISEEIASLLEGGSVTCRQWTEQDLGPYYLDGQPVRRDITEGRPGVPLGGSVYSWPKMTDHRYATQR